MALREHSACEQARGQAVAQREALRTELALLSQAKTDVEERLEQVAGHFAPFPSTFRGFSGFLTGFRGIFGGAPWL